MRNKLSMASYATPAESRNTTFTMNAAFTAEERLLAAVLLSAIDDIRTNTGMNRRRAFAWFASRSEGTFSFLGICEFFNLNADRVRKVISI